MGNETFSATFTKGGKVRIFWQGRCVMTLGGKRAEALKAELEGADFEAEQYALQRVTGNFKRGNERLFKSGRG